MSPATQVSPACYAQEDWVWAPDLHEVTREQEIPVCVRTSHRDCETSFTAITGRESRLGRQFLPFRGVLVARTPVAPDSARLSFLPLNLSMPCPSILPLLSVLPPTGTVHKILVRTPQGFVELKTKHPNEKSSFLTFQLLPEVLQACVCKSSLGLSWSQCYCPTVISVPGAAAVGGLYGGQ